MVIKPEAGYQKMQNDGSIERRETMTASEFLAELDRILNTFHLSFDARKIRILEYTPKNLIHNHETNPSKHQYRQELKGKPNLANHLPILGFRIRRAPLRMRRLDLGVSPPPPPLIVETPFPISITQSRNSPSETNPSKHDRIAESTDGVAVLDCLCCGGWRI